MGASGYGPLDNDGAHDWMYSALKGPINKALRSKDPTIAFAAMGALVKLDALHIADPANLEKAEATVRADPVDNWRSPGARRKAINRVAAKAQEFCASVRKR